ncbi:MAG: hypothetical protein JSR82_05495 [Verrucomicrobia bacterium]|nr:hypothetical protein [Verrucomicrobiota bacterium]
MSLFLRLALISTGTAGLLAQPAKPAPKPPPPDTWNFTVTPTVLEVDGYREPMLIFQRNESSVAIGAPEGGWIASGTTAELAFVNPKVPGARISLRKSSLPVPKDFDAAWTASLRDTLLTTLPKDAKNGKVTDLSNQPISANGWKTFEGRLSFNQAGDRYVWSYLFLKLHEQSMLEGVIVCRESDLPATRAALFSILPTFQMRGPARGTAPDPNQPRPARSGAR